MKYSLAEKLAIGIFGIKSQYTPASFFLTKSFQLPIFQVKGPHFLWENLFVIVITCGHNNSGKKIKA